MDESESLTWEDIMVLIYKMTPKQRLKGAVFVDDGGSETFPVKLKIAEDGDSYLLTM